MDLLSVLIVFATVIGFAFILLCVLAFVLSAISSMDDAYDDLHAEKEYLEDYKAKRR